MATAQKPYKVVPYEPQAANVIDRQAETKVGYVLQWAHGWSAYLANGTGKELQFGWAAVPEHLQDILGPRRAVFHTKYRADAAERVWKEAQG